jgi:DNA-binding CsgD family transcriptional regulator
MPCTAASPDPRRRALAGLLATQAGDRGPLTVSSDPGLQFQAVDAFGDLIEQLALAGPLVAGLDDLQWADPSSLLTIGTLGGRLADVPVAVVAWLRPSPRAAELDQALAALDAGGARRLPLGRLGEDAVAELVAEVLDAQPGRRLLAEVAGAGGNCLFVTELVRWPLPSYQEWLATERFLAGECDDALECPVLGPDLVRLALALAAGDPERAMQVAAAVEQVAAGDAVPWITGAALRCRGLARDDPGLLCAAVDAYAQGPRPFELAWPPRTPAPPSPATATPPRPRPAAAGPGRLRAPGRGPPRRQGRGRPAPAGRLRRGRRGARRRPQLGWGSLTPTEQRVVALVAEGLSTPQIGERLFVSRRTVQTHLAHVFAKLGISSRTQLAAEAARQAAPSRS